jgi:hypothetical protein
LTTPSGGCSVDAPTSSEIIEMQAAEAEHRNRWTTLLKTVPGCESGISFLPAEKVGVQHSHGQAPEPTLHPYRRPEQADGLLIGIEPDETWPSRLQHAKAAPSTPPTTATKRAIGYQRQPSTRAVSDGLP